MTTTETTIESTIKMTKTKDGFEEIFRTHSRMVLAQCLRYTRRKEDAEDLFQEIFIKVHRCYGEFEGHSSPGTWIYRIATNHCLDHLRNRKRAVQASIRYHREENGEIAEEEGGDLSRYLPCLEKILSRLDEVTRKIIFLQSRYGLTHHQIAQMMGVSRPAITKRLNALSRKIPQLRREIDSELEDEQASFLADGFRPEGSPQRGRSVAIDTQCGLTGKV